MELALVKILTKKKIEGEKKIATARIEKQKRAKVNSVPKNGFKLAKARA